MFVGLHSHWSTASARCATSEDHGPRSPLPSRQIYYRFVTWLVELGQETSPLSPHFHKSCIFARINDASPECCSITHSALQTFRHCCYCCLKEEYLSAWFIKWDDSRTADKRGHCYKTEVQPRVMTAQPEKWGWKVVVDSEGHIIKLSDKMYVLHSTSRQRVSDTFPGAVRTTM
jgi:hypothetical protein